ncbi:MAG: tetratricopeptide repeat protein [Candidatus Thorarchaeota archaeon]
MGTKTQFERVLSLSKDGELDKALHELDCLEKDTDLLEEYQIEIVLLRSSILLQKGNYKEAFALTNIIFDTLYPTSSLAYIDAQLIRAECFYKLGKYQESFDILNEIEAYFKDIEESEEQVDERYATFLLLKGIYWNRKTEFEQALVALEEGLAIVKEIRNEPLLIKIYINLGTNAWHRGEYDQALEYYRFALRMAEKNKLQQHIISALNGLGVTYLDKGNLELAAEYYQECLEKANLGENLHDTLIALNNLGNVYRQMGDSIRALEHYRRALAISEELENKPHRAFILNNIGMIEEDLGELGLALVHYQQGLSITEELSNHQLSAILLHNVGHVYQRKGQLDQALDYLHRGLSIMTEIGNKFFIAHILNTIGLVHQDKGAFKEASDSYERALVIREEISNPIDISESLLSLITLNLRQEGRRIAAEGHNKRLKELANEQENPFINLRARIADAMLLATGHRLKDKMLAQEMFSTIMKEKMIDHTLTVFAALQLCDLLLVELLSSWNEQVQKEIGIVLTQLADIAEKQNSTNILTKTIFLQAKLALIELDIDQALNLLQRAQSIAKETGLLSLAISISNQYDSVLDNIDRLTETGEGFLNMTERINLMQLERTRKQLVYNQDIVLPAITEEIPLMLLVFSQSKGLIFQCQFPNSDRYDVKIIESITETISSLGKDVLNEVQTTRRTRINDINLIYERIDSLVFFYLFKGQSFLATEKLTYLTQTLRLKLPIWQNTSSESVLGILPEKPIQEIIPEVFDQCIVETRLKNIDFKEILDSAESTLSEIDLSDAVLALKELLNPIRLAIMKTLLIHYRIPFSELQSILGVTKGRLNHHLETLVEAGLIEQRYEFIETAPRSVFYLRPEGVESYQRLQNLLHT